MAGPWELYGAPASEEEGPWTAYKASSAPQKSGGAAEMMARYALGPLGLKHGAEEAAKQARGLTTGEIEPSPKNILPWATLGIGSPVRLGLGGKTAPAPRLATTMEELEKVGTEAVTRPTGAVVPQAQAGRTVRRSIADDKARPPPPDKYRRADEWPFQEGPAQVRVKIGVNEPVPGQASTLTKSWVTDEGTIGHIVRMAESRGTGSEIASLNHIKKVVPPEEWASVQGATLARMGQTGSKMERNVGFDPVVMLNSYKNMPDAGKGILFGGPDKGGLRIHLDSLVKDMDRIEKLRIPAGPMDILREALTGEKVVRYMADPSTAAPMAQWSRAFTRLIEQGRSPASMASLQIATRNLENSLGEKLDLDKLTAALNPIGSAQASPRRGIADINRPLPEEEEARRRINERGGGAPVRADERETGLKVIRGVTDDLIGRGWDLPFERMRQSKNVQIPDRPSAGPMDPWTLADLYSKFWAGAEKPIDELATQAGAYDLGNRFRRR